MSNNTVILIGNLGQQPELRETASGMAVCNFSVATNERQKKGEEWTTHTEWHNITVFGTQARNCAKYLAKGSKVVVQGKLRTEAWKDAQGADRKTTKIIANSVTFMDTQSHLTPTNYKGQDPMQRADESIPF